MNKIFKSIIFTTLAVVLIGCGNKKMEEFSKSKGCDYCTESQIKSLVEKANKGDDNAYEQVNKNYMIWDKLKAETLKSSNPDEEIKKQADMWLDGIRNISGTIKAQKMGEKMKKNKKVDIIPQKMW